MNIALWILQAVLAIMFGLSGLGKLFQPRTRLAAQYPWMTDFSDNTVKFIGLMEVLGAVGLILPGATGIVPVLTAVAAAGLALMMLLGVLLHIRRKETRGVVVAGILLILAAVVAWGRFGPYAW
ncbi:DoxX family protein [Hamadaea tsunoensis]|uniref:DoxX family protein n=1 Tax=Hamadaea tsunoensis TaxID=53368 RepID=UPI00041E0B99|nr:DoxX family protein [Hamadaea tsunoensis]